MRSIVAYDDFRRRVGLLKRALNGLTNIRPVVETGDQDGNGWPLRKALQGDRGKLAQPCVWARSVARFCFPDHAVIPLYTATFTADAYWVSARFRVALTENTVTDTITGHAVVCWGGESPATQHQEIRE